MSKKKLRYQPDITNVEHQTDYDNLIGITTTIYNDPITKKEKEGRATIISIDNIDENFIIGKARLLCTVTFIGDHGRTVQRFLYTRRRKAQQLELPYT